MLGVAAVQPPTPRVNVYPLLVEGLPDDKRLSIKQALLLDGVHGAAPPKKVRLVAKPVAGYAAL